MDHSVLDPDMLSQLREMSGGDVSVLKDLLQLFREDAASIMERLTDAATQENATALREAAHSLKGGAANLGAIQLSKLCYELEMRGKDRRLDGVGDVVERVKTALAAVCMAMEAEIARG
jgi:HPt (histidine-containing phosphotransfer) domain-containing protein